MAVTINRQTGTLIAVALGRVDSTNANEFQEQLTEAFEGGERGVILDLGGLSYISSAGLRVILLLAKSLRSRKAKFAVCSPSEPIRELFEISGFAQIIPVHCTQGESIAAFDGEEPTA